MLCPYNDNHSNNNNNDNHSNNNNNHSYFAASGAPLAGTTTVGRSQRTSLGRNGTVCTARGYPSLMTVGCPERLSTIQLSAHRAAAPSGRNPA